VVEVKLSRLLIIAFLISVLILSSPVYAATLTGTLGGTGVISDSYIFTSASPGPIDPFWISASPIEISPGTTAVIRFDNGKIPSFFSRTPVGDSVPFTAKIGSDVIGTGSFGYMRNFDTATPTPNELDGYQYLVFNSWNPGTYTGNQAINLTLTGSLNGLNWTTYSASAGGVTGRVSFTYAYDFATPAFFDIDGSYIHNRQATFSGTYTVTKPSGLGITGTVSKAGTFGKVFIINGTSGTQLSSEDTFNVDTYNINVPAESIKICVQDTFLNWYNTSELFSVPTPTPTPTPIPSGGYTLIVTPSSVNYGSNFTATVVSPGAGAFPDISEIYYGWSKSGSNDVLTDSTNPDYLLAYSNITGTWFERDNVAGTFSINRGALFPTPVVATTDFDAGVYTIDAYLTKTDGTVYSIHAPLTVTSGGMQTLTIVAKDFETGFNLNGAHINVKNWATGIWTNKSPITGSDTWYYPYNSYLFIESERPGWITAIKNWTVSNVPTYELWMIMYSGVTPPAANVTLQVAVYDSFNLAPIPGALVHVYALGQNGESKLTSSAGVTTFNTTELADYTIAVTKYGYQNGGTIINTGPGGVAIDEVIMMNRATAPTPTVTVPTAVPSGVPTMVGGNYTGFWAPMYNMFGAMGADALTLQLLMACFFVFCGVVVGGFGMGTIIPGAPFSGTGAEAGGVFAFVLACAFGFISLLWLVVIFVWLAFRYFLTR
jgi:hypothetical protein